jgi:thiamine monophosphate kinase
MQNIREYTDIRSDLKGKFQSDKQLNKLFESDCEILKLSANKYLTTSIDSLSDEIHLGLYQEVETWAWISVMASVSDLAASGSRPLGLTLSTQWKYDTNSQTQKDYFSSVHKACKKAKVPLLGGDSGYAASHVFTSSIMGESKAKPLMREALFGDYLVLHHQKMTGIGPALAFRFLMNAAAEILPENLFRPAPSWELSEKILKFCRGAIDTSDGVASSISILNELNGLGCDLTWNEKINHPSAIQAIRKLGLSEIFLWLGDHGDFQTLYIVPEKNLEKVLIEKNTSVIGRFRKTKGTSFSCNNKKFDLPVEKITSCERNLESYKQLVIEFNNYLKPYR